MHTLGSVLVTALPIVGWSHMGGRGRGREGSRGCVSVLHEQGGDV